jgi:hypothetical protein
MMTKGEYADHNKGKGIYYDAIIRSNRNKRKHYDIVYTYNDPHLHDVIENDIGKYVILRRKSILRFTQKKNHKLFPVLYDLSRLVQSDKFELVKTFEKDKYGSGPNIQIYKRIAWKE